MIHIALHFLVPLLFAGVFYRSGWRSATMIMLATLLVDLDHLVADPIYDPDRCSIGFHPLHGGTVITLYLFLFAFAVALPRLTRRPGPVKASRVLQLIALGLLLHMALDWLDCQ